MFRKKERNKKIIKIPKAPTPPADKIELPKIEETERPKPRHHLTGKPPKKKRGRPAKIKPVIIPPVQVEPEPMAAAAPIIPTEEREPAKEKKRGRQALTFAIVGTTGSGKSTKAIEVCKKIAGKNQKILIVTNNFEPEIWREMGYKESQITKEILQSDGIKLVRIAELGETESFDLIDKYYKNGVILFDDCKQYIDNNYEKNKALKSIVINHRHKAIDIIFIAHTPEEIPPRLWGYIKFAFIGVVNTAIQKNRIRVQEKDKFFAAIEQARQEMKARHKKGIENPHAGLFIGISLTNI